MSAYADRAAPASSPCPTGDFENFVISNHIEEKQAAPKTPVTTPPASDDDDFAFPEALTSPNLFQAIQGIELALHKERARSERLRTALADLHAKYRHHVLALQERLKNASNREQDLLAQLSPQHQLENNLRAQLVTANQRAEDLKTQLDRFHLEKSEEKTKAHFELQLLQSSQEFNAKRTQHLEEALEACRREFDAFRIKAEQDRTALKDQESQLKASLQASRAEQKSLSKKLAQLTAEIDQYRAAWLKTASIQQANKMLAAQRDELQQEAVRMRQRLALEQQHRQDAEAALQAERNEKYMLLSCLKSAELKLSQAESRKPSEPSGFENLTQDDAEKLLSRYLAGHLDTRV